MCTYRWFIYKLQYDARYIQRQIQREIWQFAPLPVLSTDKSLNEPVPSIRPTGILPHKSFTEYVLNNHQKVVKRQLDRCHRQLCRRYIDRSIITQNFITVHLVRHIS